MIGVRIIQHVINHPENISLHICSPILPIHHLNPQLPSRTVLLFGWKRPQNKRWWTYAQSAVVSTTCKDKEHISNNNCQLPDTYHMTVSQFAIALLLIDLRRITKTIIY